MPHLIIEYSANLESDLDVRELVRAMHDTAATIETLPTAGIRTRAARRDNVMIADGHPDNGFINMTLRIAQGRTIDERRAAGEKLFGALNEFVSDVLARRPVALSFEIQEIETSTRWKHGNIRDYLAKRAGRN